MNNNNIMENVFRELDEGMKLKKCRQCGCMKETLEIIKETAQSNPGIINLNFTGKTDKRLKKMEPIKYRCLGCEYCYPAEALNLFRLQMPERKINGSLSCSFELKQDEWPVVPGEYFVLSEKAPVAVSTLASAGLAEVIAEKKPAGLSIVGKTETENIGIDKVIKNIITNKSIRHLIIAGKEPKGHETGMTFLCLRNNGVDENMKVIGSTAKHPVLRNVSKEEVKVFREQIGLIDMIGCEDINQIVKKIKETEKKIVVNTCSCTDCSDDNKMDVNEDVQMLEAEEPQTVDMDKAGYFVIIPQKDRKTIIVEHYSYDNKLINIIEGENARSIYWTIIKNGFVTKLSHSAYLGKELERAELSMKYGFKFVQDGAGGSFYENKK